MRGRNPKPTALKVIQGNPGGRPLPENEPQPTSGIPGCPGWLSKEAKAEWRRVALELHTIGVLTMIDRGVLAAYCKWWARWVELEKVLDEKGTSVEISRESKTGKVYIYAVRDRPEVKQAKDAATQMRAFAAELGLTPASRSGRVKAAPPAAPKDSMGDFFDD